MSDLVPTDPGPTPIPVPTPTPLPAAEVVFTVLPPEGTSPDDDLALILMDEVTGLAYNTTTHPLDRLDDGRWQVRLTPPVGSLLRYRYTRRAPTPSDEANVDGKPIEYRVAQIPGPIQINDIIATWTDSSFQGPVGRIIGRISDQENGIPLSEMIVVVAGLRTFSDGEGTFRIEGIPPGLHQLTAFHPTGEYQTVQQGAVIAPESTTPVELHVPRARKVQVTFEVTVPSDTIPGTPLRIAGNVHQMGNTFGQLAGGLSLAPPLMPSATLVTPTNYLAVVTLYSGTDLRYKYTLGDGLWNAERNQNGFFVTRQLIVPDYDLIVKDTVSSWRNGKKGSVQLYVTIPEDTPASDQISLQFNPFTWFEPLPIWRLDENEWFYVLHGPLDFSGTVGYRYCRNLQCGSADDVTTASPNAMGRPMNSTGGSQELRDEVEAWWWLEKELP
ncbi:MAG: hypothetical protein GTO14_11850, partial [Anaerolineales bacterium]|nr:hypothetical protein [Anaerolineales bacterium]